MKIKLSPTTQGYVKTQQAYLQAELREAATLSEVLDGIVRTYFNLSVMLGVDAALLDVALADLINRGGMRKVRAWVNGLDAIPGFWGIEAPSPEEVTTPSYADLLRAKAYEVAALERYMG